MYDISLLIYLMVILILMVIDKLLLGRFKNPNKNPVIDKAITRIGR